MVARGERARAGRLLRVSRAVTGKAIWVVASMERRVLLMYMLLRAMVSAGELGESGSGNLYLFDLPSQLGWLS